jgi:hypothetical protein
LLFGVDTVHGYSLLIVTPQPTSTRLF